MACVNSDGTLTQSARTLLRAAVEPAAPEAIAAQTGLPLYRVRSSMRELADAGLLEAQLDGKVRLTAAGVEQLRSD
jgi:Mn-dependent DtxR family transcriptional regulator